MTRRANWLDRMADRWGDRMLDPGPNDPRLGPPGALEIHAEHVAELACPPDRVWSLLTSPAGLSNRAERGADVFVLPGPGPERWCVVERVAGGMLGGLVEVVARTEGERIAIRRSSSPLRAIEDWTVFDASDSRSGAVSLVRLSLSATVRGTAAEPAERGLQTAAARAVARVAHQLTGTPAPPPLRTAERESAPDGHVRLPVERQVAEAQVVVPLSPEAVWAGVLDAGTYTLDAAPGERAGVVPGTPAGQVGEMRCLVAPLGDRSVVRFHEVVEIGPGSRLVLRHHSTSHPTQSVTTVEPHEDGSLVRMREEMLVHAKDGSRTAEAVRAAVLAHLVRFREEVVRRAGTQDTSGRPPAPSP